jgi:hypothetical protein
VTSLLVFSSVAGEKSSSAEHATKANAAAMQLKNILEYVFMSFPFLVQFSSVD